MTYKLGPRIPMSEAPKDGTLVLVKIGHRPYVGRWDKNIGMWGFGRLGMFNANYYEIDVEGMFCQVIEEVQP